MLRDLEVTNESACCWEEIPSYVTKIDIDWYCWPFKYDWHQTRFLPLRSNDSVFALLIWPQNSLYFCVGQEAGAVKQRSESEGENKVRDWAEKRRKAVVSPTVRSPTSRVDSPTSDMTVCLRVRKSHPGALKSDFVGKKPRLLAMYNYFCGHLISRK